MSLGQKVLGRSGLRVSDACLGTMTFGTSWGWGADEATCAQIYTAFREAGGNFIDTANLYTSGESEQILGRLIAGHRDEVVIATKFTLPSAGDPNSIGAHRKSLRRSLETSLQRLGTDYVDVLYVHAWDQKTPLEETMRALDDVARAGHVLAIGASNIPAWVVSRADALSELHGWTRSCSYQLEYSLIQRTADRELLPMADALDLAVLAWSPLARGFLAGKARPGDAPPLDPRAHEAVDAARQLASAIGCTAAQVALAFVRQRGLTPILGARSLAQITDNLAAGDLVLEADQMTLLDDSSSAPLGYPHEFLRDQVPFLQR